jgi:hypothetical protein
MTTRATIVTVGISLALVSAGCHKLAGPVAATPGAVTDYRTLSTAMIETVITCTTNSEVKLKPAGVNKYTGTRKIPGETMELPVTVTVEESRIIVETRGGGLTQRQIITTRGIEKDDLW